MHLTPITLFIRDDKQFAEKKKTAPTPDDSPDTSKLLSRIGKRRDFRKYRRVSAARQNRAGPYAGEEAGEEGKDHANEYINLLLGNSINLQLRPGIAYTKLVLCDGSVLFERHHSLSLSLPPFLPPSPSLFLSLSLSSNPCLFAQRC